MMVGLVSARSEPGESQGGGPPGTKQSTALMEKKEMIL
jgi:hypothetical protein